MSQHYRIDINTFPPSIPEASCRLKIHGLIARPLVWTLADLRARPAMYQFITLSCISNTLGGDLIGTALERREPATTTSRVRFTADRNASENPLRRWLL